MPRNQRLLRALFALFAALGTAYSVHAQSTQGSILGTVKDSQAAMVPNATVVITNTDENRVYTTTADAKGNYQALNLLPAHYRIEVSKTGFDTHVDNNLILSARQQLRVDVILTVGKVTQQVEVDGSAVGAITTDSPAISSAIDSRDVLNLPANYRGAGSTSPLNVIQTLPGVQADSSSFPPKPTGTSATTVNFSIQGGLPSQADTTIDGISAQNVTANNVMPNSFPSAEMIAEIRVDGVGNNAEFGQPGEVTTITKSGTNNLHGSAYWYFQNSGFDATPFGSPVVNGVTEKPKKVANDFGVSAGGPVVIPHLFNGRDKTFFFGDYEGFVFPQTQTVQYLVPTDAMKQGNFTQELLTSPLPNPFVPGTSYANYTLPSVNPSAAAFMSLFPEPNVGNLNSEAANLLPGALGYNYNANKPNNYGSQQFDARIDHYIGSKSLLFGRFTYKNIDLSQPQNLNIPNSNFTDSYRSAVTSYSYNVTPNAINEFRFGFTLEQYGQANSLNGASYTNAAGFEDIGPTYPYNGISQITFTNMTGITSDRMNLTSSSRTWQFNDNFTWTKDNHTMKFGADIRLLHAAPPTTNQGADNYGNFNFNGMFTGNQFADYDLGLPNTSEVDDLPGEYDGNARSYAVFAQDNWKVTPRLDIIYGLRYELHPPFVDSGGNIGNFDPSVPLSGRTIYPDGHANILAPNELANYNSCAVAGVANPYATGLAVNGAPCTPTVAASTVGLGNRLRNYSKLRFAPRLGFAWRPFGNDRTVFRGAFGDYAITTLGGEYAPMTATLTGNVRYFDNLETPNGPQYAPWPNTNGGANTVAPPTYGTAYFGTGTSINWKDPYSLQWNLSIDHDLGRGIGLRVSYIALKSDQLVWGPAINEMSYSTTTPALQRPLTDRPFPNWGTINMRYTGAQAFYNSGQVELSKHYSNGLQFNSAYTFAGNLSDAPGTDAPSSFTGEAGGRATYGYDRHLDWGNVYGTRRQRWISTGVYDLPFGRGKQFGSGMNRIEDALLGGWRLSSIFLDQTGPWLTPYIPNAVADPSGTGASSIDNRYSRPDRLGSGIPRVRTRSQWLNPNDFACPSNTGYTATSYAGNPCTVGVNSAPIGRFGTSAVGDVEGPGTVNLSSGLSKVFSITEGVKLRAEGTFTNVLNHTNLADPNMNITQGTFGSITSTRGSDFGGNRTGQVSMRLEF